MACKQHFDNSPPLLEDEGVLIEESGVIVQYLRERYGNGRLLPQAGIVAALRHLQLMHFSEGSCSASPLAWPRAMELTEG